jgi:hypothetical protein
MNAGQTNCCPRKPFFLFAAHFKLSVVVFRDEGTNVVRRIMVQKQIAVGSRAQIGC